MSKLPERWLRALLLLSAVLLSACGPGGGGTGTGPLTTLNFSAAPLPGAIPAGTTSASVGDAACTGDCTRVDLQLQDTKVELALACSRFAFDGEWGTSASGSVTLSGKLESVPAGTSSPATLKLQFSAAPADSSSVTITLLDAAGQVLLGPIALAKATALLPRGTANCSPVIAFPITFP